MPLMLLSPSPPQLHYIPYDRALKDYWLGPTAPIIRLEVKWW